MAYQRGSGFVGLQQYLNANQQQAQQLGAGVAGRLEGEQAGVMDAGSQVLGDLQRQVNAGVPQYLEPSSVGDAERKAASTSYTGPEGLTPEQIAALGAQADTAEAQSKLGGTDAGVATLLQQQYGKGYAGVGGRSLDAFLARRGAGARLDAAPKGMDKVRTFLGALPGQAAAAVDRGRDIASGVGARYASYQPPPTLDEGVRRNPIQAPGTMPDKKPARRARDDPWFNWLTGGR